MKNRSNLSIAAILILLVVIVAATLAACTSTTANTDVDTDFSEIEPEIETISFEEVYAATAIQTTAMNLVTNGEASDTIEVATNEMCDVSYTASNGCIAISESGVVTAQEVGAAFVSVVVRYEGMLVASEKVPVTVSTTLESIEVEAAQDALDVYPYTKETNESTQTTVTATAMPFGAVTTAIYESSDEGVAVVDAEGVVTAVGEGNATITVTDSENAEITAACNIVVTRAASDVQAQADAEAAAAAAQKAAEEAAAAAAAAQAQAEAEAAAAAQAQAEAEAAAQAAAASSNSSASDEATLLGWNRDGSEIWSTDSDIPSQYIIGYYPDGGTIWTGEADVEDCVAIPPS